MNTLVFVLRLIHILGGVFWVGSSIVLGFYVAPTVADGRIGSEIHGSPGDKSQDSCADHRGCDRDRPRRGCAVLD